MLFTVSDNENELLSLFSSIFSFIFSLTSLILFIMLLFPLSLLFNVSAIASLALFIAFEKSNPKILLFSCWFSCWNGGFCCWFCLFSCWFCWFSDVNSLYASFALFIVSESEKLSKIPFLFFFLFIFFNWISDEDWININIINNI
jgi:hypothetical protein